MSVFLPFTTVRPNELVVCAIRYARTDATGLSLSIVVVRGHARSLLNAMHWDKEKACRTLFRSRIMQRTSNIPRIGIVSTVYADRGNGHFVQETPPIGFECCACSRKIGQMDVFMESDSSWHSLVDPGVPEGGNTNSPPVTIKKNKMQISPANNCALPITIIQMTG